MISFGDYVCNCVSVNCICMLCLLLISLCYLFMIIMCIELSVLCVLVCVSSNDRFLGVVIRVVGKWCDCVVCLVLLVLLVCSLSVQCGVSVCVVLFNVCVVLVVSVCMGVSYSVDKGGVLLCLCICVNCCSVLSYIVQVFFVFVVVCSRFDLLCVMVDYMVCWNGIGVQLCVVNYVLRLGIGGLFMVEVVGFLVFVMYWFL